MKELLLIVIGIVLLAVSFAAFFPNFVTAMYLAFDNQFWSLPSAGVRPSGGGADELGSKYLWLVGVLSLLAALGLFNKAFRR